MLQDIQQLAACFICLLFEAVQVVRAVKGGESLLVANSSHAMGEKRPMTGGREPR